MVARAPVACERVPQSGCTETSWRAQNVEIVQFVTRL